MIIKKNHSKNCDISNLCIELVVKEMSQWDVSSRNGAALLKERLPGCWRCNVPAIRALQANMEPQKHTALQRGPNRSQTPAVFRLLIKIHYNLPQPLFQGAVWQPHIDNPHPHDKHTGNLYVREAQTRSWRPFLSQRSFESFHSLARTAGPAASI